MKVVRWEQGHFGGTPEAVRGQVARSTLCQTSGWRHAPLTAVLKTPYDFPMQTSVELNAELARQVTQLAAREGRTPRAIVEEAVTHLLSARRRENGSKPPRVTYPTYGGGGAVPDVDLSDNSAVRDFLDEGVPPEKLR